MFDSKGEVITSSGNTFGTDKGIGHAELNVARIAAVKFPVDFLEVNQARAKYCFASKRENLSNVCL
ncbi:MAG: hypothetical protein GY761_18470 [Hyphomicrobiales bacterium]|nr:hypothetical protein [Hyphomicrobiales bacterium]